MRTIRILTLGDLYESGHGMTGHCQDCAAARYDQTRRQKPLSMFDVDLHALIRERGANRWIADLAPLRCPYCGGRNTSFRLSAPSKGSA